MGPVTEQSEHLSNAQIENYGNRTSGAGPEAAQRDEPQRVDHQSIADQQMDDQSVEAHLADCASCRNRLLDFHRSLFASSANPPGADRLKADKPKNDEPTTDPPEHDISLSGHSPSGHSSSGHSSSGQRPADSRLEGVSPTDSALADSKFANPKTPADPQVRTAPTPECPSDDALRQLAAGLTPDDVAAKLTQHAATCNHCGPLLRTYTEIFSDDFTPEEQAALANLQSSSADWQKNTARQMLEVAGETTATKTSADATDTSAANKESSQQKSFKESTTTTSGRKAFFWKWILIPATAAVAAMAAFSIWYTQRDTPEKAQKLLARASTERRTLEMQFPGAAHSVYKQTLSGDSDSLLNSPASLRQAATLIDSQLAKNPDDPEWLLLSARLNLLDWRYKPALASLDKIQDAKNIDSPAMRMTRALALYEQAEWEPEHRDQSYGEIINLLGKILQNAPDDPTALFNQALACERIHAYECAISDYERLLKNNDKNGWAAEAKDHLNRIKEKKTPER